MRREDNELCQDLIDPSLSWIGKKLQCFSGRMTMGQKGFKDQPVPLEAKRQKILARQHQARLAALNNPAVRQSNDLSEVPPVNVSKKKKPGLFAKKSSKNRPAPGPPKEGERLPGDINRVPAPPPLPPGRDDLPHLTARGSRHKQQKTVLNNRTGKYTNPHIVKPYLCMEICN